jgi:two-component system, cell cycle sensor histidine kinase and response regulator CckA
MAYAERTDSRGFMSDTARRPMLDPLMVVMTLGFAVAVAALAWPAFRASPVSAPGMILLVTVAVVALVGLFAFGRADARQPAGDVAVEMLDAMARPSPDAAT